MARKSPDVTGPFVPGPFKYYVQRDGVTVTGCAPLATNCKDMNVPSGTHYYRVYSVDSSNVASPVSAAAEADVP